MAEALDLAGLEPRVAALKGSIARAEGGPPSWAFQQEVSDLIHLFYADIGRIKLISLKSLFDLFLIKVMYAGRGERRLDVLEYLSEMLVRFLWSRELFRFNARYDFLAALLDEVKERRRFQN